MSTFSNPASRSPELADAYVKAVLELVGDSDPMEILRETPSMLRTLLARPPEEALTVPEAPEELGRGGLHAERGEESVERMISLYAGHDRVHLGQMRRILAALGKGVDEIESLPGKVP